MRSCRDRLTNYHRTARADDQGLVTVSVSKVMSDDNSIYQCTQSEPVIKTEFYSLAEPGAKTRRDCSNAGDDESYAHPKHALRVYVG